tara:strand:- start:40 stop:279 length:240 start_codon:yes stop_codon:yes gene_type:complete
VTDVDEANAVTRGPFVVVTMPWQAPKMETNSVMNLSSMPFSFLLRKPPSKQPVESIRNRAEFTSERLKIHGHQYDEESF